MIENIAIPNRLAVFEDKKTKSKTVAFPFNFPDGANGVVMITKLKKDPWVPSNDIEAFQVVFKDK